jgi:hypothetical protein
VDGNFHWRNKMYDEPVEQEKFIRIVGGTQKAERLQRIWDSSFPRYSGNMFKPLTKEDVFAIESKKEGFTDKQIKAFLELK